MPRVKKEFDIHSNVIDKQAEAEKRSNVYNTKKIDAITKNLLGGDKADTVPFFHGNADWRDAGVIFDYTDEEMEIIEHCSNDCPWFVENYARFLNKKGRTLVKLYDFQRENLEIMSAEKWDPDEEVVVPVNPDICLMQARQTSKTTTIAAYIAWYSIFHDNRNVFVCANKGRTATEIMGKIKEVLEGLPYFLKPGIINISESRIKFENGTCIKCAAASKTPATGDSIQLLYIDEAALIPPGVIKEYWASVIPTMSNFPNAQLIISSTPRGKTGKFYEIVDGALKGENNYVFRRVDWWQVPGHDEKWAEKQRKKLGDDELFEREFNLSFESDSSRLVTNHAVLLMNRIKQKFVHRDFYMVPQEISDKIYWAPDFDPTYMDYETLYRKSFLFVVDTAKGIENASVEKNDSDYNVINIFEIEALSPNKININRNNGPITIKDCVQYKQVGLYIDNYKDEAQSAEACKFIAFQILKCGFQDIDNVRILIEMNFNGDNWITKFKQHPSFYDAIILKTVKGVQKPGQPITKMKLQYGFRTTGGEHGKNYYCDLGAKMIHRRQIIVRQVHQNVNLSSINQLNQFGKTKKGNYEGSCCHDDIAVTCLFVSIAQESRQFIVFLNEWLEKTYQTKKVQMIEQMLNIYIEKEAQMSDEMFHAFYKAASAGFGKLTHKQKGYGSLMSGQIDNQGFMNGGMGNGFNVGFGNMLGTRKF